jgi:phosphoglycolate phosphatase
MGYKNILFDLDGTLIDSANGIEKSFHYAYEKVYGEKCTYDIRSFIGPPINEVLFFINKEKNQNIIKEFINHFKFNYDNEAYKKSELFSGVIDTLNALSHQSIQLFVATNKRKIPTQLILSHLKISSYFTSVYCIDSFEDLFNSKVEMVQKLLAKHSLKISDTLMVGDTIHDGIAANENNIHFALVKYGYGDYQSAHYNLSSISQLLTIL